MKTDILKLKAALIALAVACSAQVTHPMQTDIDGDAIMNNQHAMEIDNPLTQEQFIESMFLQIRDTVKAIADLIESFVDKNNKESFTAFINRCQEKLKYIEKNILAPLEAELARVQAQQPGSTYHKTLELTFKLAQERAYKELQILHTILFNHRWKVDENGNLVQAPDAKKATALVGVLKPHLTKLTSITSLDELDNKLTEIYNLLVLEKHTTVTQELEKLKKMVQEIKIKTTSIQNKVNIELLPIISAKLKRL